MRGQWVQLYKAHNDTVVVGPFETAEAARDWASKQWEAKWRRDSGILFTLTVLYSPQDYS